MEKYEKPDLGTEYIGIETIKKYVKEMQADYENSYNEDILGYVLWILDDYKKMKQGDGTNFSRITASPELLARWLEESIGCFCDTYNGEVDCGKCPIADDCDVIEQKRLKQLRDNSTDNISISDKDYWLAWLKQENDKK